MDMAQRSDGKPQGGLTYADSGVSIEEGDRFAESIRGHMRRTHGPRVIDRPGGFAGLLRLDFNETLFKRNYRDPVLVACTDGVGTKIKLACKLNRYEEVGVDVVAMCVNDLVVEGAEPLMFLDYLGVHRVDRPVLERLVKGISDACREVGAALIGGETAEMGDVYREGELDVAGFAVGVLELDRAIDSDRVEPGDVVIGLESDGVHSNGFSLVHAIIERAGLDLSKPSPDLKDQRPLGEVLLTPTRLYAAPVVHLLKKYRVKKIVSGMSHITGGGLAGNLERSLHNGVDANIDRSAWTPHEIFGLLQAQGDVAGDEMDRVFNMGIGFCLIVRPSFAQSVVKHLEKLGERPAVIGSITQGTGKVHLSPRP